MVKKYVLSFFLLLVIPFVGWSQLYVGPACIERPNSTPSQEEEPCVEPTTFFEKSAETHGIWTWDMGNGTIFTGTYHTRYSYETPGTYVVSATTPSGVKHTQTIQAGYYPNQPLFNKKIEADTTVCAGSSVTLDPFKATSAPSNVDYLWFPNGETTPTIEATEPGCYSVQVRDRNTGCTRSAIIVVKACYEQANQSGEKEKWYFGQGSGIEFSIIGDPKTVHDTTSQGSLFPREEVTDPNLESAAAPINEMNAEESSAIVFDQNGKMVFYTDAKKVYYAEDNSEIKWQDGSEFSLNDNYGAQGLSIIPKPLCNTCKFAQYYLISTDRNTGLLSYAIIDMRYNDQKGAVIAAEIPLEKGVFNGKITAERSSQEDTYIIYAYKPLQENFSTLSVTKTDNLLNSRVNPNQTLRADLENYMSVSPDQNKLAHGYRLENENYLEIWDILDESNVTTPIPIFLGKDEATIYGVAFSPNSELVYVTLKGNKAAGINSKLYQINISTGNKILIEEELEEYGAIALGPKFGQITKQLYLSVKDKTYVPYLQSPNEVGKNEVGFMNGSFAIKVAGRTQLDLPNIMASEQSEDGDGISANYDGNCMNAPTVLTLQKVCDPYENEVEWRVEGKTLKGSSVSHTFSKEGWHDIEITITIRKPGQEISGIPIPGPICTTLVEKGKILIHPAPQANVPNPLRVCTEEGYYTLFKPEPTGGREFEFLWMTSLGVEADPPNGRRDFFEFKVEAPYRLEITNEFGCSTEYKFDVVKGCEPLIHIPTVMTPNEDGLNDNLKIESLFIENPTLEIYNRWGERVFETNDLDKRWDGKYKGKVFSNQLYPYVLKYFARDFPERGPQKITGSVLLLTH